MKNFLQENIGTRSPIRLFYHHSKAFFAALICGFPARKLIVIGITGTDGKTTAVGMTAHILHNAGIRVGALSTAFFRIDEKIEWNETQKTSPSPFVIQKFLRRLTKEGCTHAVLECSSHGLVQGRLSYTWPQIAGITNTSMEHLDYHKTMKQYQMDKGILFKMLKKNGTKVLNSSDDSFQLYSAIPAKDSVAFSTIKSEVTKEDTALWTEDLQVSTTGSQATVYIQPPNLEEQTQAKLELTIPGSFNIENALCAIACAKACGITIDACVTSLQSFPGMPGRLERIEANQDFSVYVDFTVTPGAYEKTLSTLRSMLAPDQKLLVLTGSCGDRMKEKRPLVGKVCSELADVVVVTNEDPYTEDPQSIIDEVWAGIDESSCQAKQIFDRKEAMQWLLAQANAGDIVILCAKGSDTTMWTAEGQVPWNERGIAKELLLHM